MYRQRKKDTLMWYTRLQPRFQVWRLSVTQEQKLPFRQIVQEHSLDVWGQGKDWVDVMVQPNLRSTVMFKLASNSIHSKVMIDNVHRWVSFCYLCALSLLCIFSEKYIDNITAFFA